MRYPTVEMDILCELASKLVERQWHKEHPYKPHSFKAINGDLCYIPEVQDEFVKVLDLLDEVLNGDEL